MYILQHTTTCVTVEAWVGETTCDHETTSFFIVQVYKSFPYYPSNGSFDSEYSLNNEDIAMLVEYGFTVVRLYVAWPGVEPSRGKYNASYLDTLYKIVEQLGKAGIYTILDCHQDLWSPKFCGGLH